MKEIINFIETNVNVSLFRFELAARKSADDITGCFPFVSIEK